MREGMEGNEGEAKHLLTVTSMNETRTTIVTSKSVGIVDEGWRVLPSPMF